jgi:hypothetical protein
LWRSRWNVDWQGKPKFSENTFPTFYGTGSFITVGKHTTRKTKEKIKYLEGRVC